MSNDRNKPGYAGQLINIERKNIKLIKKIGEGGYSYVHLAQDVNDKKNYAIKQVIASDDKRKNMLRAELNTLKCLKDCSYILQYYGDVHINDVYFILLEYCPISLFECINKRSNSPFEDHELLKMLAQTTKAIQYMHEQSPPLINRDLKVDNILINDHGYICICDFGSVTTEKILPSSLKHAEKCTLEESLKEYTTPYYRSPEMLDFYLNYAIDEKCDIWALGCIYYFLSFFCYPFEDGAKLAILSLKYKKIKSNSMLVERTINQIINRIFVVNPSNRPSAKSLYEDFKETGLKMNVNIEDPVFFLSHAQSDNNKIFQNTQLILDNMFSKAGNIFETFKETGNKIKAQINKPSVKKSPIPFNMFTSRIGIMSCPNMVKTDISQGFDGLSSAESLSNYLNKNHPSSYAIINLVNSADYPITMFENRVITYNMIIDQAPNLPEYLELLRRSAKYLSASEKRIVIFHCKDGGYLSHYFASLLVIYTRAMSNFENLFKSVLISKPHIIVSPAHNSFIRYAKYVETLCSNPGYKLLSSQVHLSNLTINPVFFCNRNRTCSRPFVNIFVDGNLIFSTVDNPSKIKEYKENDKTIDILLNVPVCGNIKVIIYHISSINEKLVQKRLFSFQFHTAFLDNLQKITLPRAHLDIGSNVLLNILKNIQVDLVLFSGVDSSLSSFDPFKFSVYTTNPYLCFNNPNEASLFESAYFSKNPIEYDFYVENRVVNFAQYNNQASDATSLPQIDDTVSDNAVPLSPSQITDHKPNIITAAGSSTDMFNLDDLFKNHQIIEEISENKADPLNDPFGLLSASNHSIKIAPVTTAEPATTFFSDNPFEKNMPGMSVSNSLVNDMFSFNSPAMEQSQSRAFTMDKSQSAESLISSSSNVFDTILTSAPLAKQTFHASVQDNISGSNYQHNMHSNMPNIPMRPMQSVPSVCNPLNTQVTLNNQQSGMTEAKFSLSASSSVTPKVFSTKPSQTSVFGASPRRPINTDSSSVFSAKSNQSDPFGDILTNQGFSKPMTDNIQGPNSSAKPSMNEARRLQDEDLTQDPVKKAVKGWSDGKRKNIRALLSTLHLILWPTDKWVPVSLHQMNDADQVKKLYRKACICVHPDKHTGTLNEHLARAIFCELNESWNAFESAGSKLY